MRKELEAARRKSGRSTTQEMLRRLQRSFDADRKNARDPALQAISYLICEVAEGVSYPFARVAKSLSTWRSNPFLYRAFKLAVGQLLDALEPKGAIKRPIVWEVAKGTPVDLAGIVATPEALADFVVAGILQALIKPTPEKAFPRWDSENDYAMDAARRDLNVKLGDVSLQEKKR
jgi:hypothetical protein